MKKLLVAFGVFFFFSLAALGQTHEYMTISMTYKGIKTKLYIIDVNGRVEEQRMRSISGFGISADKVAEIQLDVQGIINKLADEGWEVDHVSNMNLDNFLIVNYLLRREKE